VDGEPIYSADAVDYLESTLTNGPLRAITFTIIRDNKRMDVPIKAEKPIQPKDATPSFGIAAWYVQADESLTHPGPLNQVKMAGGQIVETLRTVISRKSDVGLQQLGGPVVILRAYGTLLGAEDGWRRVLWFSVVLNVNLALLNLLPFPVLD